MKNLFLLPLLLLTVSAFSQCFDCPPGFFPFCHGVASGDPFPNSVILWTRVTPEEGQPGQDIPLEWEVAADPEMTTILQSGTATAQEEKDYTIKFELDGLTQNTTYYYRFYTASGLSMTGRTRTAPSGNVDKLRFAVANCASYTAGYYNAYSRIADRNDLSAVIFLGDYIYEYAPGVEPPVERGNVQPMHEILTLDDYRCRYAFYKRDADLLRFHQQHPIIFVWDDHEIANNAWNDGAANHNPGEGEYADRDAAARQAYFEWLPIREDAAAEVQKVYRKFSYGDLVDIMMLDTRHEGRDMQLPDTMDINYNDPDRTILGTEQLNWLLEGLEGSTARWKLLGNQVVFSPLNTLGFLDNMDAWDGYPAEREKVARFIDSLQINDVIFMTGDIHIGIAADVSLSPFTAYDPDTGTGYDPGTGEGAIAVEMVSPSVSSNNLDDVDIDLPIPIEAIPGVALAVNPHGKFVNFVDHGYYVLDLDAQRAQGDWYWMDTKLEPSSVEIQEESWFTNTGENFLQAALAPAPDMADAPAPAPEFPATGTADLFKEMLNFQIQPNPAAGSQIIRYHVPVAGKVTIDLLGFDGRVVKRIRGGHQQAGANAQHVDLRNLAPGMYGYRITIKDRTAMYSIVKK